MAAVELKGIAKSFGEVQAVKKVDLSFEEGTFTTLLGPSGCGKTTILRMVAGLETPSAGDILIKGNRVNDVPIHRRNLGLVFQNYALFPHKTIEQNVAFGLKYRGVEKAESGCASWFGSFGSDAAPKTQFTSFGALLGAAALLML